MPPDPPRFQMILGRAISSPEIQKEKQNSVSEDCVSFVLWEILWGFVWLFCASSWTRIELFSF